MKPVAQMLMGSQNYFLDGPDSDLDYKLLMMPDFNDFYSYHKVDKNDLPKDYDPEHYHVMSILTFDKNIRKGNINALEMLFSHYIKCVEAVEVYFDAATRAYSRGYLFTVWDSFIATVEGMIKNSLDRYGVNRKSASRALYLINLCYFVAEHDFVMDSTTWGVNSVFEEARELRFNEEKELPTKEAIVATFNDVKRFTKDCHERYRLTASPRELELVTSWDDKLANCMKNVVKEYLKKEL